MNMYSFLCLVLYFYPSYTDENIRMIPRLTLLNPGHWSFSLPEEQPYAMFYLDTPKSLYIGGEEVLYHYDFETMKNYSMNAENRNCRGKPYCKNFLTFMTRLDGDLMVCGTNAYNPSCWKMVDENWEKVTGQSWAEQLSPPFPGCNYKILNTGNEVYSTIPRQSNNAASTRRATLRKIYGKEPMRYTGGNLLKKPVFVESLVVEGEQKTESRIYLFFMDDNSERRTTDQRVPMIARMCKEEMGSEKPDDRNMFSTALKSRLICGNQEGQYYHFLEDIYFLQSQNLVYGLFSNAWNHSAVCTYRIEDIEIVFNTSNLFESSKKDLRIRPGKCLLERTPQETAEEAANHPELVDWVWPSGNRTVFQTFDYYRKLVVDEVTAVNNEIYRVIVVATDKGTLHKIVQEQELENGARNVLEIHPFSKARKILYLKLEQHILYVGTAHEGSRIPLDDCRAYNKSKSDCIIGEAPIDPYCAWCGRCRSSLNIRVHVLQNSTQEAFCEQGNEVSKVQRHVSRPNKFLNEYNEPPPSVYLLTCPAESKQATYWWVYGDNQKEQCTPHNGTCNLFFQDIKPGEYKCIEEEFTGERVVSRFEFKVGNSSSRLQFGWLLALSLLVLYLHCKQL
ncbi:semaphorin-7A [Pyxicephalus adspersus]|uniref:Sema domain-containing protein n=1 Tax=Pyxicephalus adspersus TaxID=30357 RepID=A0AAV3B8E9_PYXAD|nr:TPA: hypothetical protein GDO54_007408 [Pyxicephalus adspersus]